MGELIPMEAWVEWHRVMESAFPGHMDHRTPLETPLGWAWTTNPGATFWRLPAEAFASLEGGKPDRFENGHPIRLYPTEEDAETAFRRCVSEPVAAQSVRQRYPLYDRYIVA